MRRWIISAFAAGIGIFLTSLIHGGYDYDRLTWWCGFGTGLLLVILQLVFEERE